MALFADERWDLFSEGTDAADSVLGLIDSAHTKESFARWLEEHTRERPRMELRDFFGHLTPGAHFEHLTAATTAPNPVEYGATLHEAISAMPVLSHLLERIDACQVADKEKELVAFAAQATLLVALYRIAEDMGYEW